MVTIEGIPVFNAVIEGDDEGMMRVSLVDAPAVLSDFQKFKEERKPVMFSVKDEDKRLVYGVLMRADFPIYRRDDAGEYYIIYKADTIRTMAEKYLRENRQNNVNIMHEEHSDVNGVQMVQMFIKDEKMGVNPTGFADIADGSLFAEYHITNDEVWNDVKNGTYRGFSLEGYFQLEREQDGNYIEDVVSTLDGKFNAQNKKKMGVKEKIAEFVKEANAEEMKFGSMTTDKGVLSWEGEEDLKIGDEVEVITNDEDGNEVRTPAEDGEYIADGRKYIVSGGKVTEIEDVEAPEQETEEPEQEEASEQKNDAEEEVVKLREDVDALRKEMDEAYKLIDKLLEVAGLTRDEADAEDNFAKMSAELTAMRAELDSVKKAPVAEPAHSAFEKMEKKSSKMTMAQRCAEALRK